MIQLSQRVVSYPSVNLINSYSLLSCSIIISIRFSYLFLRRRNFHRFFRLIRLWDEKSRKRRFNQKNTRRFDRVRRKEIFCNKFRTLEWFIQTLRHKKFNLDSRACFKQKLNCLRANLIKWSHAVVGIRHCRDMSEWEENAENSIKR